MVALRKESVDRNPLAHASHTAITVALRKESVDRNPMMYGPILTITFRRSPQGERG